jgi:hypothetical protein
MSNRTPILFLENYLKTVEDAALALTCAARHGRYDGQGKRTALSNYWNRIAQLRSAIRSSQHESSIDYGSFDHPISPEGENRLRRNSFRALSAWCHASRKAFVVTDELKDLLLGMSFGDLEWKDLIFPYRSFALAFESGFPVPDCDGVFEACGALIAWIKEPEYSIPTLYIRFFSKDTLQYQSFSRYERTKLLNPNVSRKRVTSMLDQLWDRLGDIRSATFSIGLQSFEDLKILDSQDRLAYEIGNELDFSGVYRLVAGFCFYLQTLPPGSSHRSLWAGPTNPRKSDPNAITNDAEIFTVSSSVTLTDAERGAFGGPGDLTDRELKAHFRRGHFRRAPRTAHDPSAPKVVLVRPTLVRKDRLQEGQLVGGSQITVKPSS